MLTLNEPVRVCFLIDELAAAGTEMQLLALIRHLDRRRVAPFLWTHTRRRRPSTTWSSNFAMLWQTS